MSNKPKFLLVVNDMAWFWSHRLPLAKAILAEGYDLHLATNGAEGNREISALGIKGHDLPEHTGGFNPAAQAKIAFAIYRTLHSVRPDIVHAITLRHAFYTGICARILKTPRAVFTIAGVGMLFSKDDPKMQAIRAVIVPLFKFAFGGKGRAAIFQNPDDARALVKCGAIEKERATVIKGSGVDPVQFPFVSLPRDEKPIVLFCSRLLKAKGIGEFVHAARILRSKNIKARFQVAGDIYEGNPGSATRDDVKHWAEEGSIEWLGQRKDMPALMAASTIVTLPSYYGEGVPKVLLEAAATGRPIVTTDMPGCRECVDEGGNGYLVEARNAWALADALEKLLADPLMCERMGKAGRAKVEAGFTVDIVNAKTLQLYQKLFPKKEEAALSKAA